MSNKYPGGLITSGANAGYSVAFDGTGDSLNYGTGGSAVFNLSTGDWTVEAWIYRAVSGAAHQILNLYNTAANNQGLSFYVNASNQLSQDNGNTATTAVGTIPSGVWVHVAAVRTSGNTQLYINGVATGAVITQAPLTAQFFYIGQTAGGTQLMNGYLSNVRVVKGTALYTANFTPPTQLLNVTNTSLLTCNSPNIVDQSNNAFAITQNGDAKVSTFTPFTGTQLVPNPNTLANTQGVWTVSQAGYWMSQNKWPMPSNYPLQSLRFNIADTTYLNKTFAANGNRKTWTMAFAFKRGKLGALQSIYGTPYNTNSDGVRFEANDTFLLYSNDANNVNVNTTQVFRDTNSWYFFVVAVDTTQVTAANRVKMYVNGVQITAFATASYPALNYDFNINSTVSQTIGRNPITSNQYLEGYLADFYFIDGQQLTPSSFGAIDANTGVWSPTTYGGTYGTNGFRLSFQDNTNTTATTLGKDWSGQGNNWTPNNFSVAAGSGNDSLTDTPTNWGIDYGNGGEVRGNYCTFNPLQLNGTLVNGNLDGSFSASTTATQQTFGTLGVSSGKWYFEFTQNSSANGAILVGVQKITASPTVANYTNGNLWSYYPLNGNKGNTSSIAYGPTAANGDVIGCAIDMDAGNIWFSKNGVWMASGNPATGANPAFSNLAGNTVTPSVVDDQSNGAKTFSFNAGQRPFAYTAPSGFKALCTTNLPTPAIGASASTLASKNFNVATYTGNGTTTGNTQAITGLGFQPDFVWIKSRSSGTFTHLLNDSIRGTNKLLYSPLTDAEATVTNVFNSFDSDGFTVAYNSAYTAAVSNGNGATFVGWAWKGGGAAVSNTAGSITSQVSANTAAGISILTYTGTGTAATIGHGLGAAPKFMILKSRSDSGTSWIVYHASISPSNLLTLQNTGAQQALPAYFNSTSPTSTVLSIGSAASTGIDLNVSGKNYLGYCFAEVTGFSKFSSYVGNGSTDGPFVYTGFRPRFVLIKSIASENWILHDTSRDPYNVTTLELLPNTSGAEGSTTPFDILSNGFKIRIGSTNTGLNSNGQTYIYAAFAESPFNYSRAR